MNSFECDETLPHLLFRDLQHIDRLYCSRHVDGDGARGYANGYDIKDYMLQLNLFVVTFNK